MTNNRKMRLSIFAVVTAVLLCLSALTLVFAAKPIIIKASTETYVDVWDGSVASSFARGTGTEEDPFIIESGAQLAYLSKFIHDGGKTAAQYKGFFYKQTKHIDLNNHVWTPIGRETSKAFTGKFNGNRKEIRNINATASLNTSQLFLGLFGMIDYGVVENVNVVGGKVELLTPTKGANIGGIAGFNGGAIINCFNSANIYADNGSTTNANAIYIGGIAGYCAPTNNNTNYVYVANSINKGEVKTNIASGGTNSNETIYVGGVVGGTFDLPSSSAIRFNINMGLVSAVTNNVSQTYSAGVVGAMDANSKDLNVDKNFYLNGKATVATNMELATTTNPSKNTMDYSWNDGDADGLLPNEVDLTPDPKSTALLTVLNSNKSVKVQGRSLNPWKAGTNEPIFDVVSEVTITYNGNGNTGGTVPSAETVPYGVDYTTAGQGTLINSGKTIVEWNTAADGSGTAYGVNEKINITQDLTLYAIWGISHVCKGGTDGADITFTKSFENNGGALSITNSGNYSLSENTSHDPITISGEGVVVNVCLNGYRISKTTQSSMGGIFNVKEKATLNIYDCNGSDSKHHYKHTKYKTYDFNNASSGDAFISGGLIIHGIIVESEGIANIYGGSFSGEYGIVSQGTTVVHKAEIRGTGNAIRAIGGSFIFKNGNIFENAHAEYVYVSFSSAIAVSGNCEFTFENGKIFNNTNGYKNTNSSLEYDSNHFGGGVSIRDGATFNMEGGEISGNEAYKGGGIAVLSENGETSERSFNMTGGKIVNNYARFMGGGAFVGVAHQGTPSMSGGFGGMNSVGNNVINISGGEITGNKSLNVGGIAFGNGDLKFSKAPQIIGNKKVITEGTLVREEESNVYLMDVAGKLVYYTNTADVRAIKTSKITVTGPLVDGDQKAKIGVFGVNESYNYQNNSGSSNELIEYPDEDFTINYGYISGFNNGVHPTQYFNADAFNKRIILNNSEAKFAAGYSIVYNIGNESTGNPPVDNERYNTDGTDKATILGKGDLVYSGSEPKAVFAGWKTGSSFYKVGSEMTVSSELADSRTNIVQLFPVWDFGWKVKYNPGSAYGATVPEDSTKYFFGDTINVKFDVKPTPSGKIFLGYSTSSNATTALYRENGTTSFTAENYNSDITLYAIYKNGVTVNYDKKGASGSVPVDNNVYDPDENTEITLPSKGDLVKTGAQFKGWKPGNGTNKIYQPGDKFIVTGYVTFSAVWEGYLPEFINAENTVTSGVAGMPYSYNGDNVKATLSEGTLMYASMDPRKPQWLSINQSTGELTANAPVLGTYTFKLAAANYGNDYVEKEITLIITDAGYIVTYNGNGSTSGVVPSDETLYDKDNPGQATVKDKGNLIRTGYEFTGWNTKADGTGTAYKANDKFNVTGSVTLYAQWSKVIKIAYYNQDGTIIDFGSEVKRPGDNVNVNFSNDLLNKITLPSGKSFLGWAKASGTAPDFTFKGTKTFVIPTNSLDDEIKLYAVLGDKFSITYNGNGSSGGTAPIDSKLYEADGSEKATVLAEGNLIKAGYKFAGWNTKADGSGTAYNANALIDMTESLTLYAVWKKSVVINYYNQDGSLINFGSENVVLGETVIVNFSSELIIKITVPTGKAFIGWARSMGTQPDYTAKGVTSFIVPSNLTDSEIKLFAVYGDKFTVVYDGNGNNLGSAPSDSTLYSTDGTESATVLNGGTLIKNGFSFKGWNTKADGSGTMYNEGATFKVTSSVILYAQWEALLPTFTNSLNALISGRQGEVYSKDNGSAASAVIASGSVKYAISGAPAWLIINKDSGVISSNGSALKGKYTFVIRAANALDERRFVEKTVSLEIVGVITDITVPDTVNGKTNEKLEINIGGLTGDEKITYSNSKDGYYSPQPPIFTKPGTYEYYVKVEKDGYEPLIKKVTVIIEGKEPEPTFDINVTVKDGDGVVVPNATILVRAGTKIFDAGVTDSNGKFTFKDLPKNLYNLIVVYEETTATTVIDLKTSTDKIITLPKLRLNSILDVKEGVTDVVVDGLNDLFDDNDKTFVDDTSKSVEVKMEVSKVENDKILQSLKDELSKFGGSYVLDINLFKTTLINGLKDTHTTLTETGKILTIIIPLPSELCGKNEYFIIRSHNGVIEIISTEKNKDGEYIEVSEDKTSIILHTMNFSQYAITYSVAKGNEGNIGWLKPIAECGAHWFMLLVLVVYIVFIIFWYVILRRQRLDFVSFLVTAGFIVLNIFNSFLIGCMLCLIIMILSWLIAVLGSLMFIFGKKIIDKQKEKYYKNNPEKKIENDKKEKEKNAELSQKFALTLAAKEAKENERVLKENEAIKAKAQPEGVSSIIVPPSVEHEKDTEVKLSPSSATLSESFKMIFAAPIPLFRKTNKSVVANYLEKKYGEDVVVNKRPNFISTGLPLADTHYAPRGIVYVGNKALPTKATKLLQGVCFVYVYELGEEKTMLLLKTSDDHALDIMAKGHTIYRSKYPKSGLWFMVPVDDTFKSDQEVFDMIDKAKEYVETPKIKEEDVKENQNSTVLENQENKTEDSNSSQENKTEDNDSSQENKD